MFLEISIVNLYTNVWWLKSQANVNSAQHNIGYPFTNLMWTYGHTSKRKWNCVFHDGINTLKFSYTVSDVECVDQNHFLGVKKVSERMSCKCTLTTVKSCPEIKPVTWIISFYTRTHEFYMVNRLNIAKTFPEASIIRNHKVHSCFCVILEHCEWHQAIT